MKILNSYLWRLEGIGKILKRRWTMHCLCVFMWLVRVDLCICNSSEIREKSFQKRFQYSWQLFNSSVTLYVSLPVFKVGLCLCVRVDLSQKVYPIITDSYHYHFLRLCSPSNPANWICECQYTIYIYQCSLTIFPASKNSTTDKLDRQLIRAGGDRRPKNTVRSYSSSFPVLPVTYLPSQMPTESKRAKLHGESTGERLWLYMQSNYT